MDAPQPQPQPVTESSRVRSRGVLLFREATAREPPDELAADLLSLAKKLFGKALSCAECDEDAASAHCNGGPRSSNWPGSTKQKLQQQVRLTVSHLPLPLPLGSGQPACQRQRAQQTQTKCSLCWMMQTVPSILPE